MRKSMTMNRHIPHDESIKTFEDVPVGCQCILRCDVLNVPGLPKITEVHVTQKLEKTDVYNAKTRDDYGNIIYLMIDDDEYVDFIFPSNIKSSSMTLDT